MSCSPTGYVPENSTLSCTCNTATLGQPTGRLQWFGGTGNNINNSINDGNYGDTSLQMEPQKLVRGDDKRKKFRCDSTRNGPRLLVARSTQPRLDVSLLFCWCSFPFWLLGHVPHTVQLGYNKVLVTGKIALFYPSINLYQSFL